MKIAIPLLENQGEKSPISEHFGHAPFFGFIQLNDNEAKNAEISIIPNPLENHGPGDIPQYMKSQKVDLLIARGIGGKAIQFFSQLGIQVIRGASGNVKEIIESLIENKLVDIPYEVQDKHHHH